MENARQNLKTPEPKPLPEIFEFEPDPDAEFKHLYAGANGPSRSGAYDFESREAVQSSWLAKALDAKTLDAVLKQVDFDSQRLIAAAAGKRTKATGATYIVKASHNAISNRFSVTVRVGVTEENCDRPTAESYPFALAVAKRPPSEKVNSGFSLGNFGDGCKPVVAGEAND